MIDISRIKDGARIKYPYLSHAIFSIPLIEDPRIPFCGMSRGRVLYFNPEMWGEAPLFLQVETLAQQIWVLLKKMGQRRHYRDQNRWNLAVQLEINPTTHLPQNLFPYPGKLHLPAEDYYDQFPKEVGVPIGSPPLEGSASDNEPREWENPEREMKEFEVDIFRLDVATSIKSFRGNVPNGIQQWANSLIEPKTDWRRIFSSRVSSLVSPNFRSRRTYSKISRRDRPEIVDPGWEGRIPKIVVVVDTSGSMTGGDIRWALGSLLQIVKCFGEIERIDCDAAIHSRKNVTQVKGDYKGGGGTNMAVAMESVKNYDVLVVLTDGMTPWPEKPLKNVVALVPPNTPIPEWIRRIEVNLERRDK